MLAFFKKIIDWIRNLFKGNDSEAEKLEIIVGEIQNKV